MFGKFGNLKECEHIFEIVKNEEKEMYFNKIGIWNVMIQSYGINGDVLNAKRLFDQMREQTNICVDAKGFVTMFNALSHGGDVKAAKNIFYEEIFDENIKYQMLVVSAFVDCLSRNGCLYEAYDIIIQYEKRKNITLCQEMWLSLLSGCKIHRNPLLRVRVENAIK